MILLLCIQVLNFLSCIAQCRDHALIRECGCVLIVPPYPQHNPAVEYKACTLEQWAKCGIKQYKNWGM